ncbi:MAG: hypothetical protein JHC31_15010 [Sulfurihydrogenibium sp.]|jgi:hypothetical protein|nr:hypothetical protein [Sulfurihydrogenibium sp.]
MWCVIKFKKDLNIYVEFSDGTIQIFEKIGSVMLENYLISFCIYEIENFEPAKVFIDIYNDVLYIDNVLKVIDNEFMITSNFIISITKLKKKNCL